MSEDPRCVCGHTIRAHIISGPPRPGVDHFLAPCQLMICNCRDWKESTDVRG